MSLPSSLPPTAELPTLTDGVLPWISAEGLTASWQAGLVILLAGLAGAAITAYLTDPAFLPELGGAEELRRIEEKLEESRQAWSDELGRRRGLTMRTASVEELRAATALCEQLGDRSKHWYEVYSRQRASLVRRGVPLFVLLGGMLACLLSRSILEALAIGAAWPASLRGLGIQRDAAQVKEDAAAEPLKLSEWIQDTVREARDSARKARDSELRAIVAVQRLARERNGGRASPTPEPPSTVPDPPATAQEGEPR